MHAVSALFHGKTSSNNKIGKTNTWMDKIADIYLFLFWPFARKQSITWVCCCCCYASIFIISSFWLSSFLASQLQILLSQHTLSFWLFFQISSPSGLFRLVSQHSFSWFHPTAQPLGCGAPPLLPFQVSCYHLAGFSHLWPLSLFLWFLLTLCLALFPDSLSQSQLLPFSFSLCTFVEVMSTCLWHFYLIL